MDTFSEHIGLILFGQPREGRLVQSGRIAFFPVQFQWTSTTERTTQDVGEACNDCVQVFYFRFSANLKHGQGPGEGFCCPTRNFMITIYDET